DHERKSQQLDRCRAPDARLSSPQLPVGWYFTAFFGLNQISPKNTIKEPRMPSFRPALTHRPVTDGLLARAWHRLIPVPMSALMLAALMLMGATSLAQASGDRSASVHEVYVTTFMDSLAGDGVSLNDNLRSIFTRILARQLDEEEGQIIEGNAFEQLAKVFTFVASPPDNRPPGPVYDSTTVEAARTAANAAIATTTGSLQVTLEPAEAVAAGAQWRRANTDQWFGSSATESGIPIGGQTVEFRAISDWTAPSPATASIAAGQTTTLTRSYTSAGYRVTTTAGAGGAIEPSSQTVAEGETATFTATTESGYRIASVTGCGGSLSGSTYTTGPVTANCMVTVTFTADDPPVTGSFPLNDTGIVRCGDAESSNLDCPVEGYPGQDAEYGRDALARDGLLDKVGAGHAGFDFTKLDANGDPLFIQDEQWRDDGNEMDGTQWSCVRDNHTGLTWEVKTTDGGLHDSGHTYTWYNPDSDTNGGSAGTQNGGHCNGSECDTHDFVDVVNAQGLCGENDWRLPDRFELASIVSRDRDSTRPLIDSDFFPTPPRGISFWSASPEARSSSYKAWSIYFYRFYNGHITGTDKSSGRSVRLVRDGQ
ncbi:MAG: DUF1566 domain-containing protein, partial [Lamprobacter sp.]|uniref:DUF1566 domain-containing protein n=1 Tax=Lamprobacter sp. TaxID=3100796 RepID=UPI002B2641BE